jgi:rfaE bifunctional protein kinase chain/domain
MTPARLQELLEAFPDVRLAVFGDFFLDRDLIIDPARTEASLETGLEAYQVVGKRPQPGAAGTVTSNLAALQVGEIRAIGFVGDDGEGYELRQGLEASGVDTRHLLVRPELFTPTYCKPMIRERDGSEREINRLDTKNWEPTSPELEGALLAELRAVLADVDAVIVADQVEQPDLGVVTPGACDELAALAAAHPELVFFADSRGDISRFRGLTIKPNRFEAARAAGLGSGAEPAGEQVESAARELHSRTGRPVFVTMGEDGILVADHAGLTHVPAVPVGAPIDIVGAGDSATAGIVSALCAGATNQEAALVGNLVASITIQQLGTTGTASPAQVLERFQERLG